MHSHDPHSLANMARLSKAKFAIDEDDADQSNDDERLPEEEEAEELNRYVSIEDLEERYADIAIVDHALREPTIPAETLLPCSEDNHEADDERRGSTLTSTTISSYPGSHYWAENGHDGESYPTCTPPIIRTRFRRPESVRRMQLASPPPYGYRSPRQSILSHSRSRLGTPKSARGTGARGSLRPKSRTPAHKDDGEEKEYPLVLLHVSIIPLNVFWSAESMQELLPTKTYEDLQLLRSKLSDTVLQRGVLIPHPRQEYELLEERILEALELQEERITKCGHFNRQMSRASVTSQSASDSGIGSSSESSDEDLCAICQSHVKPSSAATGSKNRKWMIKVFAANGLMRTSAWAAAWPDMESVDVEILPWISDEARRKLDERKEEEEKEAAERERLADHEFRIRSIVEEQVRLTMEELTPVREPEQARHRSIYPQQDVALITESLRLEPPHPPDNHIRMSVAALKSSDLPAIYRPSEIPISTLLRNYLYILAQDRRNILVFFLSGLALLLAIMLNSSTGQANVALYGNSVARVPPIHRSAPDMSASDAGASVEVVDLPNAVSIKNTLLDMFVPSTDEDIIEAFEGEATSQPEIESADGANIRDEPHTDTMHEGLVEARLQAEME